MSNSTPSKATPEAVNEKSTIKRTYFLPNQGGEPFSVEAANLTEAEEALKKHLKTTKESN